MKIAICLSGLIGYTKKLGKGKVINFYKPKDFFDKNLFHNINADYFIHCWDEIYKDELLKLYNPKSFSFETPLENIKKLKSKEYGVLSSNYSKKKVVDLKIKYEIDKKIKYDLVILTRFDILIKKKINLKQLDVNKFFVAGPKKHHNDQCKCLFCDETKSNHHLNDFIFISNSSNMDKFSKAYNFLDHYGYVSNHIVTKKHIVNENLWGKTDYIFKCTTNMYPQIWNLLERLYIFPKNLVPARIYDTDIPLIRWVDKPIYLKIMDFVIFKFKIDIIYFYVVTKPLIKIKSMINEK